MFRLVTVIIRLILEPFNILQVLFCAFGIPYALEYCEVTYVMVLCVILHGVRLMGSQMHKIVPVKC